MPDHKLQYPPIPPDDPKRTLTLVDADRDQTLPHIGLVGDTYTITLSGKDTNGRFCVIDMHIPPDGGPAPHRHDFEETFILLEGEIQATFRGKKSMVRAGETVNIPANAPHQFHNASSKAVRLLCICSPAGQEEFLQRGRDSGCHKNDTSPQARCKATGGVYEESAGTCSQVSNGVVETCLRRGFHNRRDQRVGLPETSLRVCRRGWPVFRPAGLLKALVSGTASHAGVPVRT